jgi:hypothetical protein
MATTDWSLIDIKAHRGHWPMPTDNWPLTSTMDHYDQWHNGHSKLTFEWHCSSSGPLTYAHMKLALEKHHHIDKWHMEAVNWPLNDILSHRDHRLMATDNWPLTSTIDHIDQWPMTAVNWHLNDIVAHLDHWTMATDDWPLTSTINLNDQWPQ